MYYICNTILYPTIRSCLYIGGMLVVGKYLEENCLHVTDPEAVDKLYKLLNAKPVLISSKVRCNKSRKERAAFLSQIKKST